MCDPTGAATTQQLFVVGLSYKTASLPIREQFAVPPSEQDQVAVRLRSEMRLAEVVLLWTCNRVEIYGVTSGAMPDAERLLQCLVGKAIPLGSAVYMRQGAAAVRHLFAVAGGMDSMVLGETEITGQIRNAYDKARKAGLTGRVLNRTFQKALETAKELRTTTMIGRGAASVGSVAVQHAQKVFGAGLDGRSVMVIGAGDMAEKCLKHLVKRGVAGIRVVNRSIDKAELLAATFGGEAVPFGRCLDAMKDVDIVITSTGSPHIILEHADIASVMAARPGRPLVIIDIAVPRDVAPEARAIPGVHLHDIGNLEETVRENVRFRQQDLDLCWSLIDAHVADLLERLAAADRAAAARENPATLEVSIT
jgi:glutamyl-tRNA reductase